MSVEVLMSTYNGEDYLTEQLKSICSQTIKTHITIRDDGSTDSTEKIVKKFKNIRFIKGSNVGATESFLRLIDLAPDSEYYAFSDQDDVWDSDKLECAVSMLDEYSSVPALYCSNTRLVDENLRIIKDEEKKPVINMGSAIVKNYATGCTVVFNKKLMLELKKYHPIYAPFHDWWANLVCLSIGGVSIFDKETHISYRQHGNNVVSGNESFLKKLKSRVSKFRKPYHRECIAMELLRNYKKDISEENRKILQLMIKYKKNKRLLIINKRFKTGSIITDLLFKICVFMDKA